MLSNEKHMHSKKDFEIKSDQNMIVGIRRTRSSRSRGTRTHDAGKDKLKAQQITIEAGSGMKVKGVSVTVEASASLTLKGATWTSRVPGRSTSRARSSTSDRVGP